MLSGTFQIAMCKIKNNIEIDEIKIKSILEYIKSKPLSSYIYPEIIEERYDLDLSQCMKLFVVLEKIGILKQVYKLYCTRCRDFSSEVFEDINDLENQNVCEICGEELYDKDNPYKYVVVYFRVIRNE